MIYEYSLTDEDGLVAFPVPLVQYPGILPQCLKRGHAEYRFRDRNQRQLKFVCRQLYGEASSLEPKPKTIHLPRFWWQGGRWSSFENFELFASLSTPALESRLRRVSFDQPIKYYSDRFRYSQTPSPWFQEVSRSSAASFARRNPNCIVSAHFHFIDRVWRRGLGEAFMKAAMRKGIRIHSALRGPEDLPLSDLGPRMTTCAHASRFEDAFPENLRFVPFDSKLLERETNLRCRLLKLPIAKRELWTRLFHQWFQEGF